MALASIAPCLMPGDGDLPRAHVTWRQRADQAVVLMHDIQRYSLRLFSDGRSPLTELVADVGKLLVAVRAESGTSLLSVRTMHTGVPSSRLRSLQPRHFATARRYPVNGPCACGRDGARVLYRAHMRTHRPPERGPAVRFSFAQPGGGLFGIPGRGEHRDITLPKLVDDLGGTWASGLFGGLALMSGAAIFAALLINGATSFTKDINAARGRQPEPDAELKDIRRNVLRIGIASLVLGSALVPLFTHVFIPTAVDMGAATVLPAILYSLYWRRFNTRGLMWTVYGGMAVTLVMVVFSNGVSGDPATAMFPSLNFKLFDIEPGLLSTPIAFLLGHVGTVSSTERNDAGFAELQVRALTGAAARTRKDPHATGGAEGNDRENQTPSAAW